VPAASRQKGFDRAGGKAGNGAREGKAPQAAAKGGTGQGKPADGACRAWITSGGKGGGRTAKADGAANLPSLPQAGRHGAERGKGKGGRQAAISGAARGLCGTVARQSIRQKKNPACGGACKGGACAGFIHRRRIVTFPRYRKTVQAGSHLPPTTAAKAGVQSNRGFPGRLAQSAPPLPSGKRPQGRRRDH
jgi:hypothetical protein